MGYLMRFLSTDEREITLPMIEAALKQVDDAYSIANAEVSDLGDLMYGTTQLAVIEINRPGEDIFEDDVAEFQDLVGGGAGTAETRVREVLANVKAMVVVEAFWQGEESEATLAKLDPLWDWLFAHYNGLSQADNEGFYDQSGLILERSFTL
jgi:hypothetical protein